MPPQAHRSAMVNVYLTHYHDQLLGDMKLKQRRKVGRGTGG